MIKSLCGARAIMAAALFALAPLPASAVTVGFNEVGTGFAVSGNVTTSSTLNSVGGYDITGISGYVLGLLPTTVGYSGAITGLIANPNQPNQSLYYDAATNHAWYYDNVSFNATPPVNNNGVLFNFASGNVGNIYSIVSAMLFSVASPNPYFIPGDYAVSFEMGPNVVANDLGATPLPGTLALFASGLGGLGLLLRRKKKAAAALNMGMAAA